MYNAKNITRNIQRFEKDLPKNQFVLLTIYKKLKQNLQMTLQILDTFHGLGGNHTNVF